MEINVFLRQHMNNNRVENFRLLWQLRTNPSSKVSAREVFDGCSLSEGVLFYESGRSSVSEQFSSST